MALFLLPHLALADITTGLALWYRMQEGTGTSVADASGTGRTGTLSGSPLPTWATKCVAFNCLTWGGGTGVLSVTSLLGSPTALTLAAWVSPTAFDTSGGEVLSVGNCVAMRLEADGTAGGFYAVGLNSWSFLRGGTVLLSSGWRHLAYTVQPGAQNFYLDGALVASGASATAIAWGSGTCAATTQLGQNPSDALFSYTGRLDEAYAFARALSASDVTQLYRLGLKTLPYIALTWEAGAPPAGVTITGYQLQRCTTTAPTGNCTPTTDLTGAATAASLLQWVDHNVSAASRYCYTVVTLATGGATSQSTTAAGPVCANPVLRGGH
jgi:hypothetical protein